NCFSCTGEPIARLDISPPFVVFYLAPFSSTGQHLRAAPRHDAYPFLRPGGPMRISSLVSRRMLFVWCGLFVAFGVVLLTEIGCNSMGTMSHIDDSGGYTHARDQLAAPPESASCVPCSSAPATVGQIFIAGNTRTQQNVILRQLNLLPGQPETPAGS